jgi:hypothetical protein
MKLLPALQCAIAGAGLLASISANPPSIGNVLAQLIASSSSAPPAPAAASTSPASSFAATPSAGSGAAVFVTLSDQAKAAAATKVQSDSDTADRLQAFVDEQRANNASAKTGAPVSLQGILEENTEATEAPPASAQPTTGAKVEAIVAQIKTLADANEPAPFQTFTPTRSIFSNSATADGYTATLNTNAGTQFYDVTVTGNGVQFADDHFGPDHGGTYNNAPLPPGVAIGDQNSLNNNEAEDAIMITQNVATASSASASSSSKGSNSTSSVNAESLSITFEVNYATGAISVQQSAASVSAQSSSASAPSSKHSTLA